MNNDEIKVTGHIVTSNALWRLAERFCAQGVNFVISVVLARILMPEEYGLCALTMTFTTILSVFINSGLGTALIQRKEIDDLDCSTALWANICIGIFLYVLLYLAAPFLAWFFKQERMVPVLRVLGLTIVIGSVNAIQQARISRRMQFKMFFKATIIGTIISAFVGIGMAMRGMGVWALVGQHLTNQVIDTIILWISIKWKPSFIFSMSRLKPLYSFGWRAYGAQMIDTLYNNLRSILIGRYYSAEQLAFFNKGRHIPSLINLNTTNAVQSVLFPAYAKYSDNRPQMLKMIRRAISLSTYFIFPCMMGLATVSESLVVVLYTSKWLPCVPFLRICCFFYAIQPLQLINLQAILAIGRSDLSLKLEIIKKSVTVTVLVICIHISMFATAVCAIPLGVFALIVNTYPAKREFNYPLISQLVDVIPQFLMSLAMGVCVILVGRVSDRYIVKLVLQVITGTAVYIGLSIATQNKDFRFVLGYLRGIFDRVRRNRSGNAA